MPSLILSSSSSLLRLDPTTASWQLDRAGRTVLSGHCEPLGGPPVRVTPEEDALTLEWPLATTRIMPSAGGFVFDCHADAVPLEHHLTLATGGHWYGGGESVRQHWPLETLRYELAPFVTWDQGPTGLGGVLHPAWTTSSGGLVHVDPTLAIQVALNGPTTPPPHRRWRMGIPMPEHNGTLDEASAMPLVDREGSGDGLLRLRAEPDVAGHTHLRYLLAAHDDGRAAQQALLASLSAPHAMPPAAMWQAPIWTTWARFKMAINQRSVLRFAEEIVAHGFPRSVMEIDDKWQAAYGDLLFDPQRFPDPAAMVARLHKLGFRVTLWVMPFATPDSAAFHEGAERGYWMRDADGSPALTRWWQGSGALLDVSNPQAVVWFVARLQALQTRYGIDGFKFDAGEGCFLPPNAQSHEPMRPNDYTERWVRDVASRFPWGEVRSSYRNQATPLWVRLWDRSSGWGRDNGLRSIIPASLTFGMVGYPWLLPDMIGGNAYGSQFPDRELYIRWVQLNALLPAIQLSIAPWNYDQEVVELTLLALGWHERAVPTLLTLAEQAVRDGTPLVRPLFWLAPSDERSHTIDDQFALGDDTVVAPVVHEGHRSRDLYLPPGQWRDVLRGDVLEGGRWHHDYPAPLDHLPWFERVGSA